MAENGCKIIIGLGNMANWMRVSKPTVSGYIRMGMPARPVNGVWHFHLDNVDIWWREYLKTKYTGETEPEDLENRAVK